MRLVGQGVSDIVLTVTVDIRFQVLKYVIGGRESGPAAAENNIQLMDCRIMYYVYLPPRRIFNVNCPRFFGSLPSPYCVPRCIAHGGRIKSSGT